jgi:hypothetical protein
LNRKADIRQHTAAAEDFRQVVDSQQSGQ